MPIKGKTQEEFTGFTKKVGVFEGKVIAINPDKEKLVEILGTDKVKDPEYLGKDREGNDQIRLDFWMQDVNDDSENPQKDKVSFFLSSSPLQTRNGDKTKYINIQGNVSFYTPDEENLPSWFAE